MDRCVDCCFIIIPEENIEGNLKTMEDRLKCAKCSFYLKAGTLHYISDKLPHREPRYCSIIRDEGTCDGFRRAEDCPRQCKVQE